MIIQHALHPGGLLDHPPKTGGWQHDVDGRMVRSGNQGLTKSVCKRTWGWANPRQSSRWPVVVAGRMDRAGSRQVGPMRGPRVPWRERESRGRPHAGVCSTAGQVPHAWDCVLGPAQCVGTAWSGHPAPCAGLNRTPYLRRPTSLVHNNSSAAPWKVSWVLDLPRLRFLTGFWKTGWKPYGLHPTWICEKLHWIQGCISVEVCGNVWAWAVEIIVFLSPIGYMLAFSGFYFVNLRYIP